jgi:hypothetical protein
LHLPTHPSPFFIISFDDESLQSPTPRGRGEGRQSRSAWQGNGSEAGGVLRRGLDARGAGIPSATPTRASPSNSLRRTDCKARQAAGGFPFLPRPFARGRSSGTVDPPPPPRAGQVIRAYPSPPPTPVSACPCFRYLLPCSVSAAQILGLPLFSLPAPVLRFRGANPRGSLRSLCMFAMRLCVFLPCFSPPIDMR